VSLKVNGESKTPDTTVWILTLTSVKHSQPTADGSLKLSIKLPLLAASQRLPSQVQILTAL